MSLQHIPMKSLAIEDQQDPSIGTYISHEIEDNSETVELIHQDYIRRRKNVSRYNDSPFLPSFIMQSKLITLRSSLLALSLTLTLLVFWLLDSLKDSVFAILVDGDLQKHQPLAKIASVGGTLFLVMFIEFISHERKKRRKHLVLKSRPDDEVLSGGGVWEKMPICSELDGMYHRNSDGKNNCDYDQEIDGDYIPIYIFYIVGISYIIAFSIISFSLRQHRSFYGSSPIGEGFEKQDHTLRYLLGYIQYMTIESFGSIGVATFWSFANTALNLDSAKMFYGFIIACAQFGAIGGSSLATTGIGIPDLFLWACLGITFQMSVMYTYDKYFPSKMNLKSTSAFTKSLNYKDCDETHFLTISPQNMNKFDIDSGGLKSFISGIYLILRHNYLILILGVSCLYEVSLTCLDYEMKLIGLEKFRKPAELVEDSISAIDNDDATVEFKNFMGRFGQLTNILSLLLSYYIFPYLMKTQGLKKTLLIFPSLLVMVTVTTFVALPMNLPVLFVSMSLLKALTYSVNDPAKEILYIPTSNSVKFKAKFWIDVVGARIAKAIGSSINTYAGTAERIVAYGSLPSVVTAITLWVVCFSAGMEFDKLLQSGHIVGGEDDDEIEISCHSFDSEDHYDSITSPNHTYENADSGWKSNTSIELVSHPK